jgi:hypothetical protein
MKKSAGTPVEGHAKPRDNGCRHPLANRAREVDQLLRVIFQQRRKTVIGLSL